MVRTFPFFSIFQLCCDNIKPYCEAQAICNYSIPPEKDDYGIPKENEASSAASEETEGRSSATTIPYSGSPLRLLPPPLFSRQIVPHIYKWVGTFLRDNQLRTVNSYKQNTMSIVSTTVDEETGLEKKRLINRNRWVPTGPAQASYSDQNVGDSLHQPGTSLALM